MAKPLERSPSPERWGLWIEEASRALNSNLTPSENFAQCWIEVEVKYGAAIRDIPLPKLNGRTAFGVSVEKAEVTAGSLFGAPGIEWENVLVKGAPGLRILQAHGLNPGTTVRLRLLVKAE